MSSSARRMDLDITIISAKHLKNVNWRDGKLVPSVVLSLSPSLRVSTRPDTSGGSTRPVWNERFLLPLPLSPPPHSLSLKILHHHDPKLLVGSVRVLLPDSVEERIETLDLLRPSGRPHGKIRLKFSLILRPIPPPPGALNYHSAPQVSDNYTYAPAPPSVLSPPPPPPVVQNYNSAPPVSDNYTSAPVCPSVPPPPPPPVVQNYDSDHSGSDNYNSATAPAFTISPIGPTPPEQFSVVSPPRPTVQKYHSAPQVSSNYTYAPAPGCPNVPGGGPSPVVQNYNSAPPGSDNYNSATAPAFSVFPIVPPPPEQFSMVRPPRPTLQNYNFAPAGSDSCTSATAPPPPQQFSTMRPPVVQNYSFAPPVSNNSTAPGPPRPNQFSIMRPMQNYNFTPQGSNNYNYTPTCVGFPGPRPHQQSMMCPPQVKNYNFTPSGSDNYTSAPTPTCPPFPHPPPPQQSQDFSFTPPGSYNYNFSPACPPVSSPPPPQQYYNITPQGSNNYNSATAPAYPLSTISGSVPPKKTYGYNNSYYDPCNGNKNNGLVGAMRGLVLEEEIESDLESTIDYSEYSESYIGQQPSAPVDDSVVFDRNKMMMRGSEKVENKAGSKESNVGPHYDYSEYRGSYRYN